jgi:hypothetical protein
MKPNTVNLYFLVDSSNYMLAKQSIFADKFADIINQYRQQVHLEVTVSLSIFSDDYKPVFWEKPLNEIERLQLLETKIANCRLFVDVESFLAIVVLCIVNWRRYLDQQLM